MDWLIIACFVAAFLWFVVRKPISSLLFRHSRAGSITDEQVKLMVRLAFTRQRARLLLPQTKELAKMSNWEASSLIRECLNDHESVLEPPSHEAREEAVNKILKEVRRERASAQVEHSGI